MNGKVDYELNLAMLFKTLWRRLPIILLVSVIAAVFAFFTSRTPVQTTFVAKTSFFVPSSITTSEKKMIVDESSSQEESMTTTSMNHVDTCCYLATSPSIIESVIEKTDLPYSQKELSQIVSAKQENTKAYAFSVLVQNKDDAKALVIAQAFACALPEVFHELAPNVRIIVLDEGSISTVSSGGNNNKKVISTALFAAIITTCLFAFLFVVKDLTGRSRIVPSDILRLNPSKKILSVFPTDCDSDAMKRLRSNLYFSFSESDSCKLIGLTAAHLDPAKDSLALHLARSLAEMGDRVLLIDADLRSHHLQELTDVKSTLGISELLRDKASCDKALQIVENGKSSFSLLTAGEGSADASELLDSRKLLPLLDQLREKFDYILLNLEPVGASVDAASVGKDLDGVIVALRDEGCTLNQFAECVSQLEFAEASVLGFVLFKKKTLFQKLLKK